MSAAKPRDQARALALGVVLMIGGERSADAEMRQQLLRVARVFRGDEIGAHEHRKRAEGNVGEIADRRRHEIERGRERSCEQVRQRLASARYDRPVCPAHSILILPVLHALRARELEAG
jgi:hypothetical protein